MDLDIVGSLRGTVMRALRGALYTVVQLVNLQAGK